MSQQQFNDVDAINFLYDQSCPICERFSCSISKCSDRLVNKIDGRQDSPLRQRAMDQGLNIDEGIVIEQDGQLYFGAEAMRLMCLNNKRWFYRAFLAGILFRFKWSSFVFYWAFTRVRRVLLKVLGIPLISENLKVKPSK